MVVHTFFLIATFIIEQRNPAQLWTRKSQKILKYSRSTLRLVRWVSGWFASKKSSSSSTTTLLRGTFPSLGDDTREDWDESSDEIMAQWAFKSSSGSSSTVGLRPRFRGCFKLRDRLNRKGFPSKLLQVVEVDWKNGADDRRLKKITPFLVNFGRFNGLNHLDLWVGAHVIYLEKKHLKKFFGKKTKAVTQWLRVSLSKLGCKIKRCPAEIEVSKTFLSRK